MLSAFLIPSLMGAFFYVFGQYWRKQTGSQAAPLLPGALQKRLPSGYLPLILLTAGAEIVLFLGLWAVMRFCMFSEGTAGLPPAVLGITAAVPFIALFLRCFDQSRTKAIALMTRLSIGLAVLLAVEVLLCNAKSFTTQGRMTVLPTDSITITGDNIKLSADEFIITGDGSMELTDIPVGTRAILLRLDQERSYDARLVHIWMDMKDDNTRYNYTTVADRMTMALSGDTVLSIDPYGKVYGLMLYFRMVNRPFTLHEVVAVNALPFSFSVVRWGLAALALLAVLAVLEYRLYAVTYTRTRRQRIVVTMMTAFCVISTLFFWRPGQQMIVYHKGEDYSGRGPYVLTFDAFQKGQVHLDLEADPGLEELDNVYDNTERHEMEVAARWDLAYKDGKYYSYFGITPVLTLYYPLYLLSGRLPTEPMTVDFFGTLASLLLCLTILAAVRLLEAKPNFLLLVMSLPVSLCTGAIYIVLQYTDKYYVAVSCGLCYLLLALWLGLFGCSVQRTAQRCVLFGCAGLALALCAGARPTMAVNAALLLPFFFGILLRKQEKLRIVQAVSFLLPLAAGMAGLMLYNKARFGSLTDFGATYQLTVSDVHANTLRLSLLPAAFKHYFMQGTFNKTTFPYFEPVNSSLRCYGRYVYTDYTFGVLSLPALLLGTLLLPAALHKPKATPTANVLQKRAALVICFAVPVLLAWMDFCMGGVNQRYVCDVMPLITIGTVLVLLQTTDPEKSRYRYGIALGALAATFVMVLLMMVELRDCSLLQRWPEVYDVLEEALVFWK